MGYWQIAAGDSQRDYSEVFTKFGAMLVGPGDPGDYFQNKDTYEKYAWGSPIKALAEQTRDGDVVVLKRPSKTQWKVLAVGRITSGYRYLPIFDDVEGWDLQHSRTVEWFSPKDKLVISGLVRGTFRRICNEEAIRQIRKVFLSGRKISPERLPEIAPELSDEDLINHLINNGLRPKDAEELAQTIASIRRLVRWYWNHGVDVKEHETRAFLILPLLFALGWSEQRLKIEWKATDIAFFEKPYSPQNKDAKNCIMILESKRFWGGLTYAEGQGKKYAKSFPECRHLIVSDGCRYKLFRREDDRWIYNAYLNILKPRSRHPYEEKIGGAQDVFLSLMPK
jgi:hypothetical protein